MGARTRASALALAALFAAACHTATPAPVEAKADPPQIDFSGVWAGTWTGADPTAGHVTGNWVADLAQGQSSFDGSYTMSGDADCMDGMINGAVGTNTISGRIERSPCYGNDWTLTALNPLDRTLTGLWQQDVLGARGTFTGSQISRTGGPSIRFVSPPAARPGALVTVVGHGFEADASLDLVDFAGRPAAPPRSAAATVLTVEVPSNASSGQLYLTVPGGTALSPGRFEVAPGAPGRFVSATIGLGTAPQGVAINPEGRRAWVASASGSGVVSMLDTAHAFVLGAAAPDPAALARAVAVAPDGRRVYVTAADLGVLVLHPGTNAILETLPVPAGDGTRPNPQGIAISPDGGTLYVSDDRSGGSVRVIDLESRAELAAVSRGAGAIPMGVAASPDDRYAWFAFGGSVSELVRFDRAALTSGPALVVGAGPVGVAVTPDASKVFVTCAGTNAVAMLDVVAMDLTSHAVGAGPSGVAVTPDGTEAWVANGGEGTVSVLSTSTGTVLGTIQVNSGPTAIAISPDGRRAYVTTEGGNALQELGGPATLTVEKLGSGIGWVSSTPDGIACGLTCQGRFEVGSVVDLLAIPDGSSTFDGWGGDCAGSQIVMSANRRCTATFSIVPGGGGGSFPGGPYYGGCFIATAAWGSALAPEVQLLRDFRDRHLLTNGPGRAFVRRYQQLSPPVAGWLREHETARTLARWGLTPIVLAVGHPLDALLLALLPLALWLSVRVRRRRNEATLLLVGLLLASGGCKSDPATPAPVDTIAPTTICSPAGGNYGAAQYLTLASDEAATIYWQLEGNALPAGFPVSGAGTNPVYWIRIGPGTTTVRFFAVDAAGNREATRTQTFVVDVPP